MLRSLPFPTQHQPNSVFSINSLQGTKRSSSTGGSQNQQGKVGSNRERPFSNKNVNSSSSFQQVGVQWTVPHPAPTNVVGYKIRFATHHPTSYFEKGRLYSNCVSAGCCPPSETNWRDVSRAMTALEGTTGRSSLSSSRPWSTYNTILSSPRYYQRLGADIVTKYRARALEKFGSDFFSKK